MSIEGRNNPAMEMLGNRDAALKLAAENPLLAGDPVTQDFLFKGGVVNGKEEDMGEFLTNRLAELEAQAAEEAVAASGSDGKVNLDDAMVVHSKKAEFDN
jgi:hypothetical protein